MKKVKLSSTLDVSRIALGFWRLMDWKLSLSEPPAVSPARRPPTWEDAPTEVDPGYDPIAQPEPEVEFDERVQW